MSKIQDMLDEHASEAAYKALRELEYHIGGIFRRELLRDHSTMAPGYVQGYHQGLEAIRIAVQTFVESSDPNRD